MNYIDIIIAVPLIWGAWKGLSKGFVIEVASLAALILGIWCATHFSEYTANILLNRLDFNISDKYLPIVSFATTFAVVAIVISIISRILDKFLSAIALGGIIKLLGAVFGLTKSLLIMAIIIYFVNSIDSKIGFINNETKENSMLYNPMVETVQKWMPKLDFEKIREKLPQKGNLEI